MLVKKFLGLVKMPFGLLNASFSLPEWQALRMIFFAPCMRKNMFRNYNLTASLEIPESPWDSFGLFMLLRLASSRHSFVINSRLCLFRILEKPFLFWYTICCVFRYLNLHSVLEQQFVKEGIQLSIFFDCTCTPFPGFVGYCIRLNWKYVSIWFGHF